MSLYRFAKLLEIKYLVKKAVSAEDMRAQIVEHIKQSVANASTVTQTSGVMPFVSMIKADQVTLTLNVKKKGKDVTEVTLTTDKPELAGKYQALAPQVQKYLNRNWELFPSKSNGESVEYGDFDFQLIYKPEPAQVATG